MGTGDDEGRCYGTGMGEGMGPRIREDNGEGRAVHRTGPTGEVGRTVGCNGRGNTGDVRITGGGGKRAMGPYGHPRGTTDVEGARAVRSNSPNRPYGGSLFGRGMGV